MALEFIAPGVEASSTLTSGQMNEFYEEMKKTVWKVKVQREPFEFDRNVGRELYTGVCISGDGLILTSFFDPKNLLKICVEGPNDEQFSEVELVHHERAVGLALLRATHQMSYNHVAFTLEKSFCVGQSLYGIVCPREASDPIILTGYLSYQYDPNSTSISKYRTVKDLPQDHVYPIDLDDEVSLFQIADLGASNLREGRGSPVFDALGHLTGLVGFRYGGFDFAIPIDVIKPFVSSHFPSHGWS